MSHDSTNFCITLNQPKLSDCRGSSHDDLQDAILCIYEDVQDEFSLVLDNLSFNMNYKYDLSDYIYIILDVLELVSSSITGKCVETLASNSLTFVWDLNWQEQILSWGGTWLRRCESIHESKAFLCCLSTRTFVEKWLLLFGKVLRDIEYLKITVNEDCIIDRVQALLDKYPTQGGKFKRTSGY